MPYYPALINLTSSPRLDQSITPTWTGAHIWTVSGTTIPIKVNSASGASGNLIDLQLNGTARFSVSSAGIGTFSSSVIGGSDGIRFTSVGDLALYNLGKIGFSSNSSSSGTVDTIISRSAAATLQLGAANAASPIAQTVQAQGSRSGTDSDIGGANLSIQPGTGTGIGTLSTLDLFAPIAVASGTGAQTQTRGLRIKAGAAVLTSYTVANLPAAATAGAGALAFVTDATLTTITGLGLAVTGGGANKVVVFSDATNWIIL